MIKNLLSEVEKITIPDDPQKPSIQIGNFCFLIAGIELLLSCNTFVKFIYFYPNNRNNYTEFENRNGSLDITNICVLCQKYYEKESNFIDLYKEIQEIILEELGETSRGQEDINVVFLYFEKNILYYLLFTKFQYITAGSEIEAKNTDIFGKKAPYSIYTLINNSHNVKCGEALIKLADINYVFGVVFLVGNHYEIYKFNNKKIICMNTNYLLNFPWKTLTVLCVSYNTECDLNIFKLLHSDSGIL